MSIVIVPVGSTGFLAAGEAVLDWTLCAIMFSNPGVWGRQTTLST
jgi:hypothetical protein